MHDIKQFTRKAQAALGFKGWTLDIGWLNAEEYAEYLEELGLEADDPNNVSMAATDLTMDQISLKNIVIRLCSDSIPTVAEAEKVLVHELLHVLFWYGHTEDNEHAQLMEEQALSTIDVLVAEAIRSRKVRVRKKKNEDTSVR